MLKGKWKLLICALLIVCVGFMISGNVEAAINENYQAEATVSDINLEEKISNSVLLDAIGSFIYAVGSLMEWVLGKVFQLITGTNMFPWADAILFNAVPFLDVNVFTASEGSLIAVLHDFLTGTYYSLLTLASAFFGVAVMVSAVRLAITAIAEDKARYKKAIVDWLLGLVMLWGIHFFISFVLYLNEELVKMAGDIVAKEVQKAGTAIEQLSDTTANSENNVYNFIEVMSNKGWTLGSVLKVVAVIAIIVAVVVAVAVAWPAIAAAAATTTVATVCSAVITAGGAIIKAGIVIAGATITLSQLGNGYVKISSELEKTRKSELNGMSDYESYSEKMYSQGTTYVCNHVDGTKDTYKYNMVDLVNGLLNSNTYVRLRLPKNVRSDSGFWTFESGGGKECIASVYYDAALLVSDVEIDGQKQPTIDYYRSAVRVWDELPTSQRNKDNYDADSHELYKMYVQVFDKYVANYGSLHSTSGIITNLAMFFKETAWTTSSTGWRANKSVIQNAIMYVLLVSYSLVFFISYSKRLFYVIMLILMAPIVVVFDFFMKSTK